MPNAHPDLWQRYQATKAASTAKYARDIAAEMGISEAELTAARLGHDAVRLSDDARALIAALERVGETKCICRNEYAVHEQVGQFTHQHLSGHAGLVLNPRALDLRLFLSQWASAFHLNDNGRQSIQFFDHHGDALLKVYATTQTDMAAWDTLIAEHRVAAPAPLVLQVDPQAGLVPLPPVPEGGFDAVYTANTLHIMGWDCVQALFAALPCVLREGGQFFSYGPYNRDGQFTSDSNRHFDAWLKGRDPRSGLRDLGQLQALAALHGLALVEDLAMPANNTLLVWQRC